MKLSQKSGNGNSNAITTIKNACGALCRKALVQVARAKAAIFAESRETLSASERLVRLALNEAEALALQTNYPHLLFPMLAMEKVQAVAAWDERQTSLNRRQSALAA